jgi:hypothetical protein
MFQHRPARRPRLQHRLGRTRGRSTAREKRGPRRDRRAPGAGFAGSADSFNPSNMPRRGVCSAAGVRSIGRGVKSANMPRSGAAEDPREDPRSGGEISARGSRPGLAGRIRQADLARQSAPIGEGPRLGIAIPAIVGRHILRSLARQRADKPALIGEVIAPIMELHPVTMPRQAT